MSRLCLIIEKWAPLATAAALLMFTLSLFGCTIAPAPLFAPAPIQVAQHPQELAPASVQGMVAPIVAPVSKQAQVTIAATKSAGSLNAWGAIAIIVGAICCAVPAVPNGLGFGMISGGLICVLAGILLPVYSVWIGWGLVGAVALFYLGRLKLQRDEANLFGAPQSKFPNNA